MKRIKQGLPHFPVVLTADEDGGHIATFRGVYGVAQGDTVEEALANSREVLDTVFAAAIKDGETLPSAPAAEKGEYTVAPEAVTYVKYLLWQTMQAEGVSKAELARRMGIPRASALRLFDVNHKSQFAQLEAAAQALDKQVTVGLKDAV